MIARIEGEVVAGGSDWLEIRPEGIGLVLRASVVESTAGSYAAGGDSVTLHTHLHASDDGPGLFGFESAHELEVFQALIRVSGIGPRLGIRVLSALSPDRLIAAINNESVKILQSVSGVGARTAGRLVLELKGKLVESGVASSQPAGSEEALEALLALGYSRAEALEGISRAVEPDMSVENQISAALRALAGR
jgi:Holliday junction DNA helicase RuvA